ncbi:MAG: hypothetical protein AB1916_10580 [Thermodesulfobacteriota bacterium]
MLIGALTLLLGRPRVWELLGVSRRLYEAARPWEAAGLSRRRYERLMLGLSPEELRRVVRRGP